MTNCRYVRVISPDIPSKTVASLHTVGQGCRVPLLVKWELKLKIGHVIKALRNRGCPHTHTHKKKHKDINTNATQWNKNMFVIAFPKLTMLLKTHAPTQPQQGRRLSAQHLATSAASPSACQVVAGVGQRVTHVDQQHVFEDVI